MHNEVEYIQDRAKLFKLTRQHPDWGHRRLAKAIGRDPRWVAKWRKRLAHLDHPTLDDLSSRSRAPHHPPATFDPQAVQLVVDLRQQLSEQLHRRAAALPILQALDKHRQEQQPAYRLPRSRSAIYRILHQAGHFTPQVKPTHQPIHLPAPMEQWQIDLAEIFLLDELNVFEFFVVADRGTSRLVYLEGELMGYNSAMTIEVFLRLFEQHGLPQRVRFDRDTRLVGSWSRDSYPSALIQLLQVLGVEVVVCPPKRPDNKPVVERLIQTIKHEWLYRHAPKTLAEARDALASFPAYYPSAASPPGPRLSQPHA